MREAHAETLRALHDTHAPALWRYAVRLTADSHLAEDVVQEALLRAWKAPQILEQDESSARAWLFTVVRNLVFDDRRSARVRRERAAEELPEHATGADAMAGVLDSWLVTDALAALTPEHRSVIVYAYYGRFSVADIAETLGIAPGTVKSRMHYGLRALRLTLQEKGVTSA